MLQRRSAGSGNESKGETVQRWEHCAKVSCSTAACSCMALECNHCGERMEKEVF